jgi:hypothetical protein
MLKLGFKYFVLLLVLVTILPLTFAQVDNFNLQYGNFNLTKISLENTITANVRFDIETAIMPQRIVADFSELVQNPYYQQNYQEIIIGTNACSWIDLGSKIRCGIDNVLINPAEATVELYFDVVLEDNITSYELAHTFSIDNTPPVLQRIYTDSCYEGECYIKNGASAIFFEFNDNTEDFVRRKVFYKLENKKYVVNYRQKYHRTAKRYPPSLFRRHPENIFKVE